MGVGWGVVQKKKKKSRGPIRRVQEWRSQFSVSVTLEEGEGGAEGGGGGRGGGRKQEIFLALVIKWQLRGSPP